MIREFELVDIYYLLLAARWTLALTGIAFIGGGLVGLIIAFCRVSPLWPLRAFGSTYVTVIQGIPLLAWLFMLFFGLPILAGYQISSWLAVTFAFSIYAGAFLGEIWRGCLAAIPNQQWEASNALGMSFVEQLRYVIIPQAVRLAIPPSVGFLVQLIKNTSLAAIIGFVELTREGQMINASTYRPMTVYIVVAIIYFLMCFPLTQISRNLEKKLRISR